MKINSMHIFCPDRADVLQAKKEADGNSTEEEEEEEAQQVIRRRVALEDICSVSPSFLYTGSVPPKSPPTSKAWGQSTYIYCSSSCSSPFQRYILHIIFQVTVRFARGAVRGGANRGGGPARSTSAWRKMQRNLEEEPWITGISLPRSRV